jgi:pimeloyl-ACP methyl ester carboxylesterase
VRCWGEAGDPLVFFLHGGRDASATFQFVVDSLKERWRILALDWRGHGQSAWAPGGYWFQDYIADLNAFIDLYSPNEPATIVGHSLGANVSQPFAGAMPARVRRLVSLDGFGLASGDVETTPQQLKAWINSLKKPPRSKNFSSYAEMADRLQEANPRLERSKAEFLAGAVSSKDPDGQLRWAFDPRFRAPKATVYRFDEWAACLKNIQAPMLWISTGLHHSRSIGLDEIAKRKSLVPNSARIHISDVGHNLQHEAPEFVARTIEPFLKTGVLPREETVTSKA